MSDDREILSGEALYYRHRATFTFSTGWMRRQAPRMDKRSRNSPAVLARSPSSNLFVACTPLLKSQILLRKLRSPLAASALLP